METMKIKVLEAKFMHERDCYLRDEVRVVPAGLGKMFVENGWAEDLGGSVKTGDRNKAHGRTIVLEVQNGTIGTSSTEVGGNG